MSILFGSLAHVWAAVMALPVAFLVMLVLFWFVRRGPVQQHHHAWRGRVQR